MQTKMDRYLEALQELGCDAEVNAQTVEQSIHAYRWRIREYRARFLVVGIAGFTLFALWLHVGWTASNKWALLLWLCSTGFAWRAMGRYESRW